MPLSFLSFPPPRRGSLQFPSCAEEAEGKFIVKLRSGDESVNETTIQRGRRLEVVRGGAGDEEKKKTTRLTRRQDRHDEHDDDGGSENNRKKKITKGRHRNILRSQ